MRALRQQSRCVREVPTACWYRYTRSSAAEPKAAYPVSVTARWDIQYSDDGGVNWRGLNTVYNSATTDLPVSEIQTVVVP